MSKRRDTLVWGLWALGIIVYLHARISNWTVGFDNPDIGGIAYNAELLARGKLPYVDSWEFKAPGSFFLFAGIFAVSRSLDAVQLVYLLWLPLGALALVWGSARIYGPRARRGALLGCLYLMSAGQFDWNYSSWMMPIYAAAGVCVVESLMDERRASGVRAGAMMMLAYAFKKQAAVLAPFGVVAWLLARRWGWTGANLRTVGWWALGVLAVLLPLSVPYLLAGEPGALVAGLFPFAKVSAYAASMGELPRNAGPGWFETSWRVAWQLLRVFPALTVASVAALVLMLRPTSESEEVDERRIGLLWLVFFVCSLAAGGLGGGRFYQHYAIQYLPALCLLAVHPRLTRWLDGGTRTQPVVLASALAGVALLWQLSEVARGQADRYAGVKVRLLPSGMSAPHAAGDFIRERSGSEDTIMAWGWTAWPVHYWAQRIAPTVVYKPLGTLTQFNTNTAFSAGAATPFVDGPLATEVAEAFEGPEAPKFFVMSPSFVSTFGNDHDPIEDFTRLRDALQQRYRPVAKFGDLTILQRLED